MAHRTRQRAVLRERRERIERARQLEFRRIMSEFWKSYSEEPRLPGVYSETVFGSGRIRYDDLPDGPRVPGVFGEVVFARGIIMAQHMREWIRKDWIRFSDATFGERDECEVLYSGATPIRCNAVEILPVRKETEDSNGSE